MIRSFKKTTKVDKHVYPGKAYRPGSPYFWLVSSSLDAGYLQYVLLGDFNDLCFFCPYFLKGNDPIWLQLWLMPWIEITNKHHGSHPWLLGFLLVRQGSMQLYGDFQGFPWYIVHCLGWQFITPMRLITGVSLKRCQEEIQKMISDVDDDGSGTIGYEESHVCRCGWGFCSAGSWSSQNFIKIRFHKLQDEWRANDSSRSSIENAGLVQFGLLIVLEWLNIVKSSDSSPDFLLCMPGFHEGLTEFPCLFIFRSFFKYPFSQCLT